jgi:hypothetical protein
MISEPFPHRRNPDGTYDSICPSCYQTVDRQLVEADLHAQEMLHVCVPDIRLAIELPEEWTLYEQYGAARRKQRPT